MSNDIRSQFRVLFPVGPFPLEGEDSLERIFSLSGVLMKKEREENRRLDNNETAKVNKSAGRNYRVWY